MMLWLAILCLTVVTALAVGWPLLRGRPAVTQTDAGAAGRVAVYADQLAEIDADLARGVIAAAEAEAARVEVSRRLLAQASAAAATGAEAARREPSLSVRIAIVGVVPAVALALYVALGRPSLEGHPHASELTARSKPAPVAAGAPDIERLITKVEARLREAPQDGRGWDALAPVYLKVQRYEEARAAFARAIDLLGETPKRLAGVAESDIRANDGLVTDAARDAFEKVLKAEPGQIEARFWLALWREQHGETKEAAEEYRALLAQAPPAAPWREEVAERLAAVTGEAGVPPAAGKGPTAAEAAAAAGMTAEARQQMIVGMVQGLHARLKTDGRDAAGWQKLLRAYAVMGDRTKAMAALAEARQALAQDNQGLIAIDALAREMGLGS